MLSCRIKMASVSHLNVVEIRVPVQSSKFGPIDARDGFEKAFSGIPDELFAPLDPQMYWQ